MCGIFGLAIPASQARDYHDQQNRLKQLFLLSETRGKESCGIAVRRDEGLGVYKQPVSASHLLASGDFASLMKSLGLVANEENQGPIGIIAHTRLVTNGMQTVNENNQPVTTMGLTGVHNGIIVNDEALWRQNANLKRRTEVDTEVLLSLIGKYNQELNDLTVATSRAFGDIRGAASIAVLFDDRRELLLATNTGSLYTWRCSDSGKFAFASEEYILQQWVRKFEGDDESQKVAQIPAGEGIMIGLADLHTITFSLSSATKVIESPKNGESLVSNSLVKVTDYAGTVSKSISSLKRCSRCVLPESFPFIKFDAEGVCNYCLDYEPPTYLGREALEKAADSIRRTDGRPELLLAFSGGRDSSYTLHYVVKELGLKPLTFTFDWGMVTDLARRNQARMCGQLGVEHILVSADINKKRRNVRSNVEAWLKRPDLGMIPLFMAGDKQFFTHANRLSKLNQLDTVVFSACPYETTNFKTAFCGLNDTKGGMYFSFPLHKIIKLTWYYAKQYGLNPRYINSSLGDTFSAYYSSFFAKHDYLMFFDYLKWHEEEIERVLLDEYDWETSPDCDTTWRIGDGTAAFYNYIYYTVAGFTENDTFRSNQVRDGSMTREEALTRIETENQPRWDSMQWYARTIGFDFHEALRAIDSIPRLYEMKPIELSREYSLQPSVT